MGFQPELIKMRKDHTFRSLRTVDKRLANFGSNDYLGLSTHPHIIEKTIAYVQAYGTSSGGSRLISGNAAYFNTIESKIAQLTEKESALLFSTGYQANISVLQALSSKDCIVYADRMCHNSLLFGAKANNARLLRFKHNDLKDLEKYLRQTSHHKARKIIVSESLFGMNGNFSDLKGLSWLAKRHEALLYIDDAHAVGVHGKNGMGLAASEEDIDMCLGTFSKGAGSFGAFITCKKAIKEYLINKCSGFIYTTALPPAVCGSIDAALDIIPTLDRERNELKALSDKLRKGLPGLFPESHLVALDAGSSEEALSISHILEQEGIFAPAIRPPTCPRPCIRFSVSMHVRESDIKKLLKVLNTRCKIFHGP